MTDESNHFERLMHAAGLHQAGHLAEAEAVYRKLLDENANDANALHLLGILAHQRGDSHKGLQLVGKALELAPGVPMFHNNLGKVLLDMHQPDAALEHLLAAAQQDPDRLPPVYNLAECYRVLGKLQQARNCLQVVLEKDPQHVDAIVSQGKIALEELRHDESRELFMLALSIDPEHTEARYLLSGVQFACRQFAEAAATLERLLIRHPEHVPALNRLGNACMEMHRFGAAASAYRQAVILMPDDAGIRYNLALALTEQQHYEAALPHLEHAFQLAPGNKHIVNMLQATRESTPEHR